MGEYPGLRFSDVIAARVEAVEAYVARYPERTEFLVRETEPAKRDAALRRWIESQLEWPEGDRNYSGPTRHYYAAFLRPALDRRARYREAYPWPAPLSVEDVSAEAEAVDAASATG